MKSINLIGQTFDMYKVIEDSGKRSSTGYIGYTCECIYCKEISIQFSANLLNGITKRCRCIPIGSKRNELTILEIFFDAAGKRRYKCKCSCGNEIIHPERAFYQPNGGIKSCNLYNHNGLSLRRKIQLRRKTFSISVQEATEIEKEIIENERSGVLEINKKEVGWTTDIKKLYLDPPWAK